MTRCVSLSHHRSTVVDLYKLCILRCSHKHGEAYCSHGVQINQLALNCVQIDGYFAAIEIGVCLMGPIGRAEFPN